MSITVMSCITGKEHYSFALTTPATTAISFASRESSNRPQLVIEHAQ